MRTTQPRTLRDRATAIGRQIRALVRDTSEWDPSDLAYLRMIEIATVQAREDAVRGMREHGFTDGDIGQALGITQQAVSKRWPGGGRYQGAAGRYRTRRQP